VVETLGQRLQRLIEERQYGKPLSKIAKEAGVDLQTLQNAVEDKTQPRFPTMQKLAAYFQVSVEYLMTGEGSPEPPPADIVEIRARVAQLEQLVSELADELDRQQGDGKP
jgi:transcriptional regulator with XRE-family HTH domain